MLKARTALSVTLLALLCLCNCVFSAENVVSNESTPAISITFLDIEAGKAAIIDDSIDPYFDQMQEMEMSAKTGSPIDGRILDEQRQRCRERYQAGVREFTDAEKEPIRRCAQKLYAALKQQYPLFAEMPWSFLKVSGKIEGGLSHTRDKHIVVSEGTCRGFAILSQSAPEQAAMSIAGLLLHEQMHVFQRTHPGLFDSLYTEIWGFIKAKEIQSCPWLEKHHLVNPDGTDCCWVFPIRQGDTTSYIWPLVVFAEGEGLKRMPHDFRMIAVELVGNDGRFRPKIAEDDKPIFRNLLEVTEYRRIFPSTGNIYHPNEASASLFTRIVMVDSLTPKYNMSSARREQIDRTLGPLRKWFAENLKQEPASKPPKGNVQ